MQSRTLKEGPMPTNFAEGLNQDARKTVVDLLNANLVNMISLTLAVKQAHWNMKGRGFIGVHELLDDVADRLRESADTMAERAVILGGHAKGTVEFAAEKATLDAYPLDTTDIQEHVALLKDRFMEMGHALREAIEAAEEAGDEDTADLFTEVSRSVDKDAWFIGANAADAA
jgi:starvation-inducible DNA-binding protein